MNLLITGAYKGSFKIFEKHDFFFHEDEEKIVEHPGIYEGIICNRLFLYNPIKNFKNLKFIQTTSVGFDRIPINYVKEKKIIIKNAGNIYSKPMAEWVVLKILEIYKESRFFEVNKKNSVWKKNLNILELEQKKVLIIGYGNVGKEIAKRLKPFNVDLTVIGKSVIEDRIIDRCYLMVELDEILRMSDIVVITLPLNNETKGVFNEERIKKMKQNSLLINLSRGEIIDEKALIKYSKKFLGIALDVFEKEPLSKTSPLWTMENVFITPHVSYMGDKVIERLEAVIYENFISFKK